MDDEDQGRGGSSQAPPASAADAEVQTLKDDAHRLLVGGATLGTFAVVTSALVGATCPMCVVVAPVMLGAGAVQRWRAARKERVCIEAAQRLETPDTDTEPA